MNDSVNENDIPVSKKTYDATCIITRVLVFLTIAFVVGCILLNTVGVYFYHLYYYKKGTEYFCNSQFDEAEECFMKCDDFLNGYNLYSDSAEIRRFYTEIYLENHFMASNYECTFDNEFFDSMTFYYISDDQQDKVDEIKTKLREEVDVEKVKYIEEQKTATTTTKKRVYTTTTKPWRNVRKKTTTKYYYSAKDYANADDFYDDYYDDFYDYDEAEDYYNDYG